MNNIIKRKWNQNSMVIIEDLQGMAFQAESGGHTFQISGIDGEGNTVALSGTPAGVMLRADGQDVTLTCSVSGGVVSATLPANAYVVPGRFGLTIFLTSDGQKTAIYAAVGTVGKTSSGTVAPPAGSDVVDLVNAINTAISGIPATDTALKAAMAPTYSNSALYAVGEYAWYNGTLYRCTTPITSGETWTSGHWTAAAIGTDSANGLRDLKSALNVIDNLYQITGDKIGTWQSGKTISNSGTIGNSGSYSACDTFITVPPFATALIVSAGSKGIVIGKYSSASESAFIERSFYNANTNTSIDISTVKAIRIGVGSLTTSDAAEITIKWECNLRNAFGKNTDRDAFTYSNEKLTFTLDGTTIKVSPQHITAYYKDKYWQLKQATIDNNSTEISVPHDSYLIFNIDNSSLEVKARTYLRDNEYGNYVILFYNSNGNVKGNFEKYSIEQNLDGKIALAEFNDAFLYGDQKIKFTVTSEKTIKFAPKNVIVFYRDTDGKIHRILFDNNYTEISVPADSFAVFNIGTSAIEVYTRSELQNSTGKNYVVLFYNSQGYVKGLFEKYVIQQRLDEAELYPDYYTSHMAAKEKQINLQLAGMTKGDGFVFITDAHYNKNTIHSPGLAKDVCDNTGITTIHLNGDQITKEDDRQTALLEINRINSAYRFAGLETYLTVGNHEWNNPTASNTEEALAAQVNESDMRFAFVNPMRKKVVFDSNSISYYYDNPVSEIRYLVGQVMRGGGVNVDSIKWIAEKIADAPSGYGIVVFIHTLVSFTESGGVYTPAIDSSAGAGFLANIMDAVRAGSSYTFQNVTYDYTGKNLEMIAAFCGHTHVDLFMRTTGGVPIICTTTDAAGNELGGLTRTEGTINEQAFDVVVISRTDKKIYCNRIGAGSDRTYDFEPSV